MKPYYSTECGDIYHGDSKQVLSCLPDKSVHCCVTSPPYWGLRDYGIDGQLGLEKTPEEYVSKLVDIFREVKRVLRDDGTCWVNLGDTYAAARSYQVSDNKHPGLGAQRNLANAKPPEGLKQKDLVGIPWMVAFALRVDGWYLRQDIIWSKKNCMPESVTDRCTKSHEYIFLLSKSQRYFYDHEAIKEKSSGWNGSKFDTGKTFIHQKERCQIRTAGKWSTKEKQSSGRRIVEAVKRARAINGNHDNPFGEKRNKRSVWDIATKPFKAAHFATFPPALIEPCILAGCPKGGTVLDPFFGSGTTGVVAYKHDRRFVGIELSKIYLDDIVVPRIEAETKQLKLFA